MSKKDRIQETDEYTENILTNFNYGDLINIRYLERLFGVNKEELEFRYKMGLLKENLIEFGCVLSLVLGEGYKILFPNEVSQEVYRKYAKASLNRIGKGLKVLANVDRSLLNETNVDRSLLNETELRSYNEFEKMLLKIYRDNEDSLLMAQALIGEVKRKELKA